MIVLDASVLIAHMAESGAHADRALEILDTEDDLVIHPMTLAESLVGPVRAGLEAEALDTVDRLGIERFTAAVDEPLALARLRVRTGLKLPDCCALVSAEREGAMLATFDTRLAATARSRGVSVIGA